MFSPKATSPRRYLSKSASIWSHLGKGDEPPTSDATKMIELYENVGVENSFSTSNNVVLQPSRLNNIDLFVARVRFSSSSLEV